MKYINFVVGAVAWVPYFIPLVIEGNKRGITSYFFLRKNPKPYANPLSSIHLGLLNNITRTYNIKIKDIKDVVNYPGLTFLMEADISGRSQNDYATSGALLLNSTHVKVSFTFNADFIWQYGKYVKIMDYVVFPGKTYAEAYNKLSPKNLYLGSPKFDVPLDKNTICKKYRLNSKSNYLLFFYPKQKWISCSAKLKNHYLQMKYLVDQFRKMGFRVIIKSREKDRVTQTMGDHYYEEKELFPMSSLELLTISNLAVFFSSASIEECVMTKTPFIDFKVDHKFDRFAFLHHPSYSRIINNLAIPFNELSKHVAMITKNNQSAFEAVQTKHMFVDEHLSATILDRFKDEADDKYNNAIQIYSQIKELKKKHNEIEKKRSSNVDPILNKLENNNPTEDIPEDKKEEKPIKKEKKKKKKQ